MRCPMCRDDVQPTPILKNRPQKPRQGVLEDVWVGPQLMSGLGQPEKIWHRDNIAGLPSIAEMLTDGSTFSQCELQKLPVHPMTPIPKGHSPTRAQRDT